MELWRPALLALILATPAVMAEDVSDPGRVNQILSSFETPTVAPGETARLSFTLRNPYSESMLGVELNISIYEYATVEERQMVDDGWAWCEPHIRESSQPCSKEVRIEFATLPPTSDVPVSLTISTSRSMPHGNPLSESAYFLRFWIVFTLEQDGDLTVFRMASRGHFSDDLWDRATSYDLQNPCLDPSCRGNVNLSILGVDGVLPDTSFGVRSPIPLWPFFLLVALFGVTAVLAVRSYFRDRRMDEGSDPSSSSQGSGRER